MKVMLQCSQLVVLTFIKWQYRDAVVQLHGIGVCRIIDKDDLRKISVYFTQIFDEQIRRQFSTMLAV